MDSAHGRHCRRFACGVIVEFGGKRVYFAGDTGLFSDMKILDRFGQIDCAVRSIGDNFTMGMEDAALAALWVQPLSGHPSTQDLADHRSRPAGIQKTDGNEGNIPVQVVDPERRYEF